MLQLFIVRFRRDKMILAVNDPIAVVITMMLVMMMMLMRTMMMILVFLMT